MLATSCGGNDGAAAGDGSSSDDASVSSDGSPSDEASSSPVASLVIESTKAGTRARPGGDVELPYSERRWKVVADGGELVEPDADVADLQVDRAAWSPDRAQVAFTTEGDENDCGYLYDLWVMDADGAEARVLAEQEPVEAVEWSSDGSWVVYQVSDMRDEGNGCAQFGSEIRSARADGSEEAEVSPAGPPPEAVDIGGGLEPGYTNPQACGDAILFESIDVLEVDGERSDVTQFWLADPAGGHATRIVGPTEWQEAFGDWGSIGGAEPSCNADGTEIAFSYNDFSGIDGLARRDLDRAGEGFGVVAAEEGAIPELLAEVGQRDVLHPVWSPDGSTIAAGLHVEPTATDEYGPRGIAVALLDVASGELEQHDLTKPRLSLSPFWSRDGAEVFAGDVIMDVGDGSTEPLGKLDSPAAAADLLNTFGLDGAVTYISASGVWSVT